MMSDIKLNAIYQHYKGNIYFVEEIAICTETEQEMVVYRDLYHPEKVWVRSLENFLEPTSDGQIRFKKLYEGGYASVTQR